MDGDARARAHINSSTLNPLVLGKSGVRFPAFYARRPWLGGDLQTLRNTFTYTPPDLAQYRSERLTLPMTDGSGDELWALLNYPQGKSDRPLIVLIHGLTGSENSRNIMTSAAYHLSRGYPVLRLNLRGAGPSLGKATEHYNAGRSSDIRDALAALPAALTASGIYLVGVSLGGNIVLKFLGEGHGTANIRAAAAVCAPIDLKMAQLCIMRPRNWIYHRHLLRNMRDDARKMMSNHQARITEILPRIHTVYDFDDLIVAPSGGFASAESYYAKSSAKPFLDAIKIPTLVVHPRTDPWVPARMYLDRVWQERGAITLVMPPDGGHVGFHTRDSDVPWHDRAIALFFGAH